MSIKAYEEYKDSGVEWLGEVPAHWIVTALKRNYSVTLGKMLQPEKKKETDRLCFYLRAANIQNKGIVTHDVRKMWFNSSEQKELELIDGDLLVSEGGDVGRPALWDKGDGYYFQNSINRIRAQNGSITKFLYYWIITVKSKGYIDVLCNKSTIAHFTADKVSSVPTPVPSLAEQTTIAAFLDHETARIDALIEEQQRLIALLKEKRQAVISHAVTKGLDPNVPMKDSGVEWLGNMPAHWDSGKIRHFAKLESGHTPSRNKPEYWENCYLPWFTLADVWQIRRGKVNIVEETKEKISELGLENSSARILPKDTVILSRTASVGYSAIMGCDMATTQDFANWICGNKLNPWFLLYTLRAMKDEFRRIMTGSTHKTIYMPDISELSCALPTYKEQLQIVAYIDNKTKETDALIQQSEHIVLLLQERRSALISAAVTGKIDVRDWQPPRASQTAAEPAEVSA